MSKKDRIKRLLRELMARFSAKYRSLADKVTAYIKKLIKAGETIYDAVTKALAEIPLFGSLRKDLDEKMVQAAADGYGITPIVISAPQKAIIIQKLNTLPWAPDRMPLSTRLHGMEVAVRQAINDTIQRSMKDGTNWVKLARELYDGYGYGQVTKTATLPKTLDDLQRAARQTLTIDVNNPDRQAMADYGRLMRQTRRLVDRMAKDGAPNKALKASYKQLYDAALDYSEKALDKAIYVAIQERSRYFAERIARTELARAWADGFYAQNQDDPDVIAYRWRLSSRHPKYDICDFHSKANLYGLGPGVYPKNSLPPQPAHPHCLCHWEGIFDGELDGMRQRDQVQAGGEQFLKKIDPEDRRRLLGFDGDLSWLNGGDWRRHLRQWQGHEDPRPRLTRQDFMKDAAYEKLFTPDKVVIPEAKILKYALDKDHPTGGPKAVAFELALGYTKDNYQELIKAIKDNIGNYKPIYKGDNTHGQKFEVIMPITGPNGKTANVLTAWMIDHGKDFPRLISPYVTEKEVGRE